MQITLPISYISHGKEKFRENDKYAYFIHNVTTFGRKLHKSLKQNDLYLLFRKGDFHKLGCIQTKNKQRASILQILLIDFNFREIAFTYLQYGEAKLTPYRGKK